jgi:simple sugar transport system permease protein
MRKNNIRKSSDMSVSENANSKTQVSANRLINYLIKMRSLNVFFIFLLLFIVFSVFSPGHRFLSKENILIFLAASSEFNIIAIVVAMLMIAGEFDLSVGSILVFCSFTFLKLFDSGMNVLLALIINLGIGSMLGFFNGIITVKTKIPSFITTLGAMLLWRGVTLFWSGGLQKGLELSEIPIMYNAIAGTVGGILSVQFIWFVGIAVVVGFIVHSHKFGNWVISTGDNKLAARAMGINTDRIKMICFTAVGFVVSFAAVMQMFRSGTFSARAGDGWELKAIAASVVGGTALTGGIGSIAGVFWGAMVISIIENGLVFMRVPYYWTFTIFGVVIVSSVLISLLIEKKRLTMGVAEEET